MDPTTVTLPSHWGAWAKHTEALVMLHGSEIYWSVPLPSRSVNMDPTTVKLPSHWGAWAKHTEALVMLHGSEIYWNALAIKEREYGPDHREIAVTLGSLGK